MGTGVEKNVSSLFNSFKRGKWKKWMEKRTDGWMDKLMDQQTDGWTDPVSYRVSSPQEERIKTLHIAQTNFVKK